MIISHEQAGKAVELLMLINMEFKSDPMSVQCFDLRTVKQVDELCEEIKSAQRS